MYPLRAFLACSIGLVLCVPLRAGTIFVDPAATGANTGASWRDAATSLSEAIGKASAGDEVWVAQGEYGAVTLKNGVKLLGGFSGRETSASQSDPELHKTVITGTGSSRAIVSIGNDKSTVLRGFTITDGFVDLPEMGAGMYMEDSNAVIARCVFTRNKAVAMGGAVAIRGGSPTFMNCRFFDNDGGYVAGAVFTRGSNAPVFVNCLFHNNRAWEGGAVSVMTGAPAFVNCTFAKNEALKSKGGAIFDGIGRSVIRNCIVWDNTSPVSGANEIYNKRTLPGVTRVSHSTVRGGWRGDRNLQQDPLFVDAGNGDFRLKADSPCRDTGRDAFLSNLLGDSAMPGAEFDPQQLDLDLRSRIAGNAVDMGAFEFGE